ncbi:MAG: PAS domain S-box protein [Ignavibacteriales bacterium]|nr:PAS domain S-box protein [Ignavibacteriales bacterium]
MKRKDADMTLSNPELFFRQVIENAGGVPFQLIFGQSLGTGYYKYIGAGIKDLLGIPPSKFTEKLFGSLVEKVNPLLPEIPNDPSECRRRMVKGNIPHYKADILIRTTKGKLKWINDSSLPIHDQKTGKIIGAQGILIDIDERKRIETDAGQNVSLLRATLESTADGILVVDSLGKISDFNNQFAQMWRIPDAILATHNDKQAIDFVLNQLKNPKDFISKVKELYDNPEKESYDTLEFKDGRCFERFSHPQKIDGKPVGRVWSFRDITNRTLSEKSLKESEEKFRVLADQSPNMIFINQKGRIVYANKKCEEIIGFTREEFLSPSFDFRSLISSESQALIQESFRKHSQGEEVPPYEYGLLTRKGKKIQAIITSKLINFAGQSAILGIITDISERKVIEVALRNSEKRLQSLFASMTDVILVVDAEGRYIEIAPTNPALLYRPANELLGKTVYEVFPTKQADFFIEKIKLVLTSNRPISIEYSLSINNKEIWFTATLSPMSKTTILLIARDITEHKQAEETIRRNEQQLKLILNTLPMVFYTGRATADLTTTWISNQVKQMTGYTSNEFTENATFWQTRIHPDDFDRVLREYAEVFKKNYISTEYRWHCADDSYRWFTDQLVLVRDEQGLPKETVGIWIDITERKRAEEALLQSEERYRSLFDRMMDGVYRSTHDGRFVDVNDAMVKMFGFSSKKEMLNVDIKKELYFAPSERDSLFLDTGEEKTEVFRMRRKDGSEIWVEDHGRYVHDEKGNVIFHEGILRNVTDRLRNEVLQNAIYQISQGSDKSPTLEDLFKSVHTIISTVMFAKNFYISLHDDERDLLTFPYFVDEVDISAPPVNPGKGLTAYVLRTGKPLLCDEATDMKLRQQGEVELVGAPSAIWLGVPLIVSHKTIGVMVVQHYSDPTAYTEQDLHMLEYVSSQVARAIEQKRSEEKLRQSEEQFRLISENVADLIAVLDLNGKRVYSSPSYKNIFGDFESLRGTDSFQDIHPEDRDRIKQIFQETVKTGIGQRAEYRFLLKDGRIRHIESQGSIINDKEGKISQVVVVSRDVTEKKILEQQFLRSQRMESIGTLAGGIAHDLNNVLAPIVMAIGILRKHNPDKTIQRLLDSLESSAQRGSDIVKQVLAFARGIEGDRVLLQPKHIIAEVVQIIKETFPKSIDIRTELLKNLWAISADPTQLHQVLLNVCVNARDAMYDGGKLTITAENSFIDDNYSKMHSEAKVGPYIMISVSDTGMGIPPKILDKIFEPFFTTKEIGKGTGLGLSTVHAIVKSHGGFINVYSEVTKGTTFKIYFPAQMKGQSVSTEESIPTLPQGKGEIILIVDDEATIRDITKSTLEANGYRAMTANDGTEAMALYAQNGEIISVVITDIMMPIMDGAVTIRALQKMNPNIKIIAASGLITSDVKNLGTNIQAFLTKPFTAEKLLTTLYKVLNS